MTEYKLSDENYTESGQILLPPYTQQYSVHSWAKEWNCPHSCAQTVSDLFKNDFESSPAYEFV